MRLGGRIRELRRARMLTLTQLAERAELSHPFLSQIERGLARPSIGSLDRIMRALGSSQLELFASLEGGLAAPDQADTVLVRSHEGTRGPYGLGAGRMLTDGERRFVPLDYTASNVDLGGYIVHAEDEFVFVITGRVVVDLQDREPHTLEASDSLYFSGGIGHRWGSADGNEYRLLVVKEGRR